MTILELRNVTVSFGGLTAVDGVSCAVRRGSVTSIIGPNGAGKTTIFNAITGIYSPAGGSLLFEGRELVTPLSKRTVSGLILVALITALALWLAYNVVSLWDALVASRYIYQQPFPWSETPRVLIDFIHLQPPFDRNAPLLGGFLVGLLGATAIWQRGRCTPDIVAAHGIARTFQNIRLFGSLTVLENVLVGLEGGQRAQLVARALGLPAVRRSESAAIARAMTELAFVGLADLANEPAAALPYGHQRRLEIARALATAPRLLLLDEPAAGMNPTEAHELMRLIGTIRDRGITVLLIEHHMKVVMGISDHVIVLDHGCLIATGTPAEVRADPAVIEAYLGKEHTHAL